MMQILTDDNIGNRHRPVIHCGLDHCFDDHSKEGPRRRKESCCPSPHTGGFAPSCGAWLNFFTEVGVCPKVFLSEFLSRDWILFYFKIKLGQSPFCHTCYALYV